MRRDVGAALEALAEAMLKRLGVVRPDQENPEAEPVPDNQSDDDPNRGEFALPSHRLKSRRASARRPNATGLTVLLLAVALVGGTSTPATAVGGAFTDDDMSTHEPNIELVADAAITQGCTTGLFCPDDLVTRAQMASFVVRALGYLDDGGGDLFSDDDGTTHETNIDLFAAAGVTLGCGAGLYCPNDPVTRGQMASFIARAFHYDIAPATSDHFTDDTGTTHEANINLLFEAGVTQGCAAGPSSFCPNDPVTRAQMASFLARALKLPWPPDHSDHPDIGPEDSDQLGNAVELGDFNGDGWDDIAIGIRGEVIEGDNNAGAVRIVYGTAGGPTGTTQFFTDSSFGVEPQACAVLGEGLAAGDFDNDGYDDLAIGAKDSAAGDVGRVMLANGGPDGLTPGGEIFRSVVDSFAVRTLVAGDFGNGAADDLAIGFASGDVAGMENAGLVEVMYGSPTGFSAPAQFHQDTTGVGGVAEEFDIFGSQLAAGDLTGDGLDELVVGVIGEDLNVGGTDVMDAGVVHVFYGSDSGLLVDTGTAPQLIHQEIIGGVIEAQNRFGSSIVIGDLTGDGIGDLIVGASGEGVESPIVVPSRGNVHIIPGSGNGPVASTTFDLDSVAGQNQPLDSDFLGHNLEFLDGDRPTIVVPRLSPDDPGLAVFLLHLDGLDTLATPLFDEALDSLSSLASGDINNDQVIDLVIGASSLPVPDGGAMSSAGGIAVWLGQPGGSLQQWAGDLIQ